ncbi:MAG: DUF1223 domain-containing protein [Deltaproteobacteria bacterium]|nr:MAG: DUF1223 domain-containing protein [Deltaproteobacteria bacterium]
MKHWIASLGCFVGLLCWVAIAPPTNASAKKPFAVLELFTSEGCSSCPPADDIARQLAKRARTHNLNIFTLVYHVDYWNGLGWRDRFSQRKFTVRQNRYARSLRTRSIYTPQLIVNGVRHGVGSRPRTVQRILQAGLRDKPSWNVALCLRSQSKKAITLGYRLQGRPSPWLRLQVSLVEWGLQSRVTRGENAGRTLKNANVVREFKSLSARKALRGVTTLSMKRVQRRSKSAAIAFVQDLRTMRVLGAQRLLLKKPRKCTGN